MNWQVPAESIPLFAAAVVAGAVAVIAIRKQEAKGATPLAALLAATMVWSITAGLEPLRTDVWWTALFTKLMYIGIAVVPPTWLLFVVKYTGRETWYTPRRIAILFVIPVFVIVASLTNEPIGIHTLFWTTPHSATEVATKGIEYGSGPLFWVHTAYSYGLLGLGSYWLVKLAAFSDHLYRIQAVGLLLTVLAPLIANALYVAGVVTTPFDPTVVGIALSGVFIMTTIYRHRLFEVVPAARELARTELIQTLDDPVVVVDDDQRVVDLNPVAAEIFDIDRASALGHELAAVTPTLATLLDREHPEQTTVTREVQNRKRHYDVQVTPLSRGYGAVTGQLLSLREITRQHYQHQQLNVLNRLLRHNLRNAITAIRGNAEYVASQTDDQEILERMDVIAANAEEVMAKRDEFERVLDALDREERTVGDAETLLRTVGKAVVDRYPEADVTLSLPDEQVRIEGRERIRIAVEELLTNAVVHHDSPEPTVQVSVAVKASSIELTVSDDGPGIPEHEIEPLRNGRETPLSHGVGVGLWLVTWIVHSLEGAVEFNIEDGTTVTITLPCAD